MPAGAGQNPAENIPVRQLEQPAAKTDDQNQLDQIVDHQTEEAVEILADEPGGIAGRWGHELRVLPLSVVANYTHYTMIRAAGEVSSR